MTRLVKVSDELMMELDLWSTLIPHVRYCDTNHALYDRRRFVRFLRRLVRRKRREEAWLRRSNTIGPTQYQTWWWLVVRNACRKYGVRG